MAATIDPNAAIAEAKLRHQFVWFGLSTDNAHAQAAEHNVPFRVVKADGSGLPTTRDHRPGRINAEIHGGHVTYIRTEGDAGISLQEGVTDLTLLPLLGLSEKAAQKKASELQRPFRVIERDGQPLAATMDYNPNRANAAIKNGIVIAITSG